MFILGENTEHRAAEASAPTWLVEKEKKGAPTCLWLPLLPTAASTAPALAQPGLHVSRGPALPFWGPGQPHTPLIQLLNRKLPRRVAGYRPKLTPFALVYQQVQPS